MEALVVVIIWLLLMAAALALMVGSIALFLYGARKAGLLR